VLVRFDDELVLPLASGGHCVAIDFELVLVLVQLVHLRVGVVLRGVGEARGAAPGHQVAGGADLAEHGQPGGSTAAVQHGGPVREQFLQFSDALLQARDALLEDGDALVEAAQLVGGLDVGLARRVGVGAGLFDLDSLVFDLGIGRDGRGSRGRGARCRGRGRRRRVLGNGCHGTEMQRADHDRQRDHSSARHVLPCHRGPLDPAGRVARNRNTPRRPGRLAISS
jgi:hypothetical protein